MPKDRGDIQGHTQAGEAGREKGRRTRERAVGGRPDLTEQSVGKRSKGFGAGHSRVTYFHWMLFFDFFSIKSIPSKTLVMS